MAGEDIAVSELRLAALSSIRQRPLCAVCGSRDHWYISASALREHEGLITTAQGPEMTELSLHVRCRLQALPCHGLIRSCMDIPQSDAWELDCPLIAMASWVFSHSSRVRCQIQACTCAIGCPASLSALAQPQQAWQSPFCSPAPPVHRSCCCFFFDFAVKPHAWGPKPVESSLHGHRHI